MRPPHVRGLVTTTLERERVMASGTIDVRMRGNKLDLVAHDGGTVKVRVVRAPGDVDPMFASIQWEDNEGGRHTTMRGYLEVGEVKTLRDRLDEVLVEMGDMG
jgi:hypothetical protein